MVGAWVGRWISRGGSWPFYVRVRTVCGGQGVVDGFVEICLCYVYDLGCNNAILESFFVDVGS